MLCCKTPSKKISQDESNRDLPLFSGKQDQPKIIEIRGLKIGGHHKVIIAGPCTLENLDHTLSLAERLKTSGISIFRGSAFKTRTSPYSFQGHGLRALEWQNNVRQKHLLPVETEITDSRQVDVIAQHVDIIRVGSRNMHNFSLLRELGKIKNPIILKRGFGATIKEWLSAAEYIISSGNDNVILCERGIRTFETSTRFSLDFCGLVKVLELTNLPVIVDPSHASGARSLVHPLAKAALAAGAHGLLIEVHDSPEKALCDGPQAITPEDLDNLIKDLRYHNLY